MSELIAQRIAPTLELSLLALVVALVIGISAGMLAAIRHNTSLDALSSLLAILGVSTPSFWLAILAVLVFSINLKWLPALGYVSPTTDLAATSSPALTIRVMSGCLTRATTRRAA